MNIGQLITDTAARDAIHVAIAPVTASEVLRPGERISFVASDDYNLVHKAWRDPSKAVGIVDPYLTEPVEAGQRFYMFLFPNTVTSLRHEWTHPAFGHKTLTEKDKSIVWVTEFAAKIESTYNRLMAAAHNYVEYGEYARDDTEEYKCVDNFDEFWKHYEIITGRRPEDDYAPFTCSC